MVSGGLIELLPIPTCIILAISIIETILIIGSFIEQELINFLFFQENLKPFVWFHGRNKLVNKILLKDIL